MEQLSTPFGGRMLTAAMIAAQNEAAKCQGSIAKWQVLRDLVDARHLFGVSDRAIAVLSALLSFHPSDEINADEPTIVYPSNRKLADRAHGISESTLRRCFIQLAEAGLIIRRDSPNGKRYPKGNLEAFGFDLKPLVFMAARIAEAASAVKRQRAHEKALRECMTVTRRDIAGSLALLAQHDPQQASALTQAYAPLGAARPRTSEALETLARDLEHFAAMLCKTLISLQKSTNSVGSPLQDERHIQDSNYNTDIDSEGSGKSLCGTVPAPAPQAEPVVCPLPPAALALDLKSILAACTALADYGQVRCWEDLIRLAQTLRPLLGISTETWREATETMGPGGAAVTLATILERISVIRNPGAYLRTLSRKAGTGEFTPAPLVISLLRTRASAGGPSLALQ